MTEVLDAGTVAPVVGHPVQPRHAAMRTALRRRLVVMKPGWPLRWLLVGSPVFWALGLSSFATIIMAVPMAFELLRRRPLKLPRGFAVWGLFLLWSAAGLLVLGFNPSGTVPGSFGSRLVGYGTREVSFVAVTIVLLYVGNLRRSEVGQRQIIRWLGFFFVATVAGGVLGVLLPNLEFTSVFEMLLPAGLRHNNFVHNQVHPASAQVMALLGDATPRPAAPFTYTNTWGFHLTLLALWFFVAYVLRTTPARRALGIIVLVVAGVVLIYSLNRAAWIGTGVVIAYIAIRLAVRGRLVPFLAIAAVSVVAVGVVYGSPLRGVIEGRLQNGQSNSIRAFTTERALELSRQSPLIGFGNTRKTYGSASSIAVGASPQCPTCGNANIGMNGYVFMLLMSTGYVGTALFFLFGAIQVWRARLLHSPTGLAGSAVLVLTAFYAPFYDVAGFMLVPFVTIGLLWREAEAS